MRLPAKRRDRSILSKAPPGLTDVLSTICRQYEAYFPGLQEPPRILSTSMEYRRLSDLARVMLQLDDSPTELFIKFHKHPTSPAERVRAKAQLEYDTLTWLSAAFASMPGYSVVRPMAYFSEYKAVVTEKTEGLDLHTWLNRPLRTLIGVDRQRVVEGCYEAGVWLRKFQELTARPETERFEPGCFQSEIEDLLQRGATMGFSGLLRERLSAWCQTTLAQLGSTEVDVVGQHPDFQPQNILVGPSGITVLDFTSFQYGNRYYDVACFLTVLVSRLKHPGFRETHIAHCQESFLRGYGLLAQTDPMLQLYCVKEMLLYCTTFLSRLPAPALARAMIQRFLLRWAETRAFPELCIPGSDPN